MRHRDSEMMEVLGLRTSDKDGHVVDKGDALEYDPR